MAEFSSFLKSFLSFYSWFYSFLLTGMPFGFKDGPKIKKPQAVFHGRPLLFYKHCSLPELHYYKFGEIPFSMKAPAKHETMLNCFLKTLYTQSLSLCFLGFPINLLDPIFPEAGGTLTFAGAPGCSTCPPPPIHKFTPNVFMWASEQHMVGV